jgi:hypothetical protein
MPPTLPVEPIHKRTNSTSATTLEEPALSPIQAAAHLASAIDQDVFPPRKTDINHSYNPDEMIEFWLHEYEDVLGEVFGEGQEYADGTVVGVHGPGAAERDDIAWTRLGEIMRRGSKGEDDVISDSESVISVGELGDEARMDGSMLGGVSVPEVSDADEGIFSRQQDGLEGDKNTWEVRRFSFNR